MEAAGVNVGDIKQIAGEHTDGPYAPQGPLPSRLAVDSITVAGFWIVPLIARDGTGGAALAELLDLTARRRLRPLAGAEYRPGAGPRRA
ncbi:hypothetical protein [Streptomyces hawaiiensis]|uniref:hypothetical protein n=1 Tax=Streptomyces hawaiiensis TaxID=67305 RepID=UPI0036672653